MKIITLGDSAYENAGDSNYGDCLIIDNNDVLVVYDCGSEEHAKTVINYMDDNGYDTVTIILSHNDSDHFDGIHYLADNGKISNIYTILLFKYIDELKDKIDDNRKTTNSIKKQIEDLYDNINSLSGLGLKDIYEDGDELPDGISIAGPDFDYMLEAVAKLLDTTEGDSIDGETVFNAASVQIYIQINSHKVLLSGDSSFEAMKDNLDGCDVIQLPHHGKLNQAEQIFDAMDERSDIVYIVSDNTGNSNGGSDDLDNIKKGHIVWNTKDKDTFTISEDVLVSKQSIGTRRCYGEIVL